ncbi:MAG: magnesium chelatase subunit D [Roseovarius sp.]
MTQDASPWSDAHRALSVLAVDPGGLKGLTVRARAGPVRQAFEALITQVPGPQNRIHPNLGDAELYGGLDVSATLATQTLSRHIGLAESPGMLILPMAERTPPGLAARLSQVLDADAGHSLILMDESADADETPPAALRDRLAFFVDFDGLSYRAIQDTSLDVPAIAAARAALPVTKALPDHVMQLTVVAAQFGIHSLRAPILALRAARALAALAGRAVVADQDVTHAAELVFAHRATQLPAEPDEDTTPPEPEPPADQGDTNEGEAQDMPALDDMMIEAIAARLPEDLMDKAAPPRPMGGFQGSGAGAQRKGNRRGRPMPSRPGRLGGSARIDLIATLRGAAPFQPMRRAALGVSDRLIIYPSDIRVRRYQDRSDRVLIFVVDASGSAAMSRMAEAKGAVELLLARAYAKRDQVALVAFRGTSAELLLPPTRSLVQAKRRLAALPAGGGTPLALALKEAAEVATLGARHGLSPSLVLLTDGRANITLAGTPGRAEAAQDAQTTARMIAAAQIPSVVIDTATRVGQDSANLAAWLGAHYLPLPRADAHKISKAADAALDG